MLNIKLQLPDNYLEGETRNGYYISPEMKKVWAVLLDLLVEFMRVCDKHHLKYYMCGGSILGAVRHGGIIPWDDDIDVMMMRDEYEKLIKVGPAEFQYPYFFQTEDTDPGSAKGHIQIRNSETACLSSGAIRNKLPQNQGIFLDVFPIDKVPERYRTNFPYITSLVNTRKKMQRYRDFSVLYRFRLRRNIIKMLGKLVFFLFISIVGRRNYYRKLHNRLNDESKKYNNDPKVHGLMLTPYPVENGIWNEKDFSDTVFMDFEMIKVPLPSGYEHILDCIYGDWHKFEIGTAIHSSVVLDADYSYLDYFNGTIKK